MTDFKKIKEQFLAESNSNYVLYKHERTKLELLEIHNEDENKVFCISFRTTPPSSNGMCHILEHSVLNGSEKYPAKEPFMHLIKSSMQTFLNAMTYPDKTIYPVASQNDKDFFNLTDVYLNSVFFPKIYQDKKILMQEGHHIHMENLNDTPKHVGVVFNEMKGAMSNPDSQMEMTLLNNSMPDTSYVYNSGGSPFDIVSLTYDEFIKYHHDYYSPSNARIILYGNMDFDKMRSHIEDNYLSKFDYVKVDSMPKIQELKEKRRLKCDYSIASYEKPDNKYSYSLSLLTPEIRDLKEREIFAIISKYLVDLDISPFRKAVMKEQLCEDLISDVFPTNQLLFSVSAKNTDGKDYEKFYQIFDESVQKIIEEGFDRDTLKALLNRIEFMLKESLISADKGINTVIRTLENWNYDFDPIECASYEKLMNSLKNALNDGEFERVLKKYFTKDEGRLEIIHVPQPGLFEKRFEKMDEELISKVESLSQEEKQKIVDETNELIIHQQTPDRLEDIEKLPSLEISDVKPKIERIERKVSKEGEILKFVNKGNTYGIDYINWLFDLSAINDLTGEKASYLSLLSVVLGDLSTKNYHYEKLSTKINLISGGINFNTKTLKHRSNRFKKYFSVSTKVMENLEETVALTKEILNESIFEDEERLNELLKVELTRNSMRLFERASEYAQIDALRSFTNYHDYLDCLDGLEYINNLRKIATDENKGKKLKKILEEVLNTPLTIKILTSSNDDDNIFKTCKKLIDKEIPFESSFIDYYKNDSTSERKAYKLGSDVQFIGICTKDDRLKELSGANAVMSNLLTSNYLYSLIRAQGGAYGAGISLQDGGEIAGYTFRDPNLSDSIAVFESIGDALTNLEMTDRDLTDLKIGSVSKLNGPMSQISLSSFDFQLYIFDDKYEHFEQRIQKCLDIQMQDLKKYAEIFNDFNNNYSLTVIGNNKKIEEDKDLFNKVESVE